jgi:hypothetical protein
VENQVDGLENGCLILLHGMAFKIAGKHAGIVEERAGWTGLACIGFAPPLLPGFSLSRTFVQSMNGLFFNLAGHINKASCMRVMPQGNAIPYGAHPLIDSAAVRAIVGSTPYRSLRNE